jgi:protein-disulfide isomerase
MIVALWTLMTAALLAGGTQEPAAPAEPPARVEIVLFSDFQCPFCAQFAQPFRELQVKGVDGVETTVRFKNFPLPMHPNAQLAHQAAMELHRQRPEPQRTCQCRWFVGAPEHPGQLRSRPRARDVHG